MYNTELSEWDWEYYRESIGLKLCDIKIFGMAHLDIKRQWTKSALQLL